MHAQDSDRIAARPDEPGQRRRRAVMAIIGLLCLAILLTVGYRWWHTAPPPAPATAEPAPPAAAATTAPAPASTTPASPETPDTPAAPITLPALEDSDTEVRATLGELLPEALRPVLAPDELLPRAVALADSLAQGRLVRDKLPLPAPGGKTRVIERADGLFLDPANYARYDTLVATLEAVDPVEAARWYLRFEPLLQQAYAALGNGDVRVRTVLQRGIDTLLAAPEAPAEIALVQPSVFYKFADPALESLPDTQKLMLRIGPRNREILTAWLASFTSQLR